MRIITLGTLTLSLLASGAYAQVGEEDETILMNRPERGGGDAKRKRKATVRTKGARAPSLIPKAEDKAAEVAPAPTVQIKGLATVCRPGDDCAAACPEGRCAIDCAPGSVCAATCAGGECVQRCGQGARCTFSCAGGHCAQACYSDRCTTTCEGGHCLKGPAGAPTKRAPAKPTP